MMGLPYIRARKLYSVEMPNTFNFAFNSTDLLRFIAVGYILGLPLVRSAKSMLSKT